MDKTLNHLRLVPHMCVNEMGQHWSRKWLDAYSASITWTNVDLLPIGPLRTNISETLFKVHVIHENASKNDACVMTAILSREDELSINPIPLPCNEINGLTCPQNRVVTMSQLNHMCVWVHFLKLFMLTTKKPLKDPHSWHLAGESTDDWPSHTTTAEARATYWHVAWSVLRHYIIS